MAHARSRFLALAAGVAATGALALVPSGQAQTPSAGPLRIYSSLPLSGVTRATVVREIFATRDRSSVLGTYSIDASGDTTLREYGGLRVRDGQLVFDRVLRSD